jgi:TolB-like protein
MRRRMGMRFQKLAALLAAVAACGCVTTKSVGDSSMASLDGAIQTAGKEISDALASGTKVAVLNFTSSSGQFSDYVIEELSMSLVKGGRLVVVDRRETDLIRGEKRFQTSGEVSDESAQEIGKLLGAQSIISGSLLYMGNAYRFRVKAINVSGGAIETSVSISVAADEQVQFLLAEGARRGTAAEDRLQTPPPAAGQEERPGNLAAGSAAAGGEGKPRAAPAAAAPKEYKMGGAGPGGGLIFYDKGSYGGGWRYLEAAPVEAEKALSWSARRTGVDDTQAGVGSGKRNTQLIAEAFAKVSGEWDQAAQYCAELVHHGFDDWFLPSLDELNLMYGNLKRKGLGDFKAEIYWSSTAYSIDSAWYMNFTDAYISGFSSRSVKSSKNYVRPVRAF